MKKNLFILLLLLISVRGFSQCPNPTTTGGQICEPGGAVNLSASGSSAIRWYDDAVAGNLVNTGAGFVANVASTTTYYVEHDTSYPSAATQMPIAPQAGTFTGNVRGYYITAPCDFTITSLYIPTDAGVGSQNIAVLKFDGNIPPPLFASTTNAFTTLYLTQNNPIATPIAVNIPVHTGEVIGFLAQRSNVNSYSATAVVNTTINGFTVTPYRMGMQFPLTTDAPHDVWSQNSGQISRVFFEYTVPIPCTSSPRVPVTATVLPAPVFSSFTSSNITCNGMANGQIVAASANPADVFSINPAAAQAPAGTFAITTPDTYTVTLTDGNSCTATSSAVISEPAPVPVAASVTPATTCINTSVLPDATGALSYVWTGGLSNGVPFIATTSDTYTVTGTDGNGCTATSSVTLTVNAAAGSLAAASSNHTQIHEDDFDIDYYDASCSLIASVDDGAGGTILGSTTATVNVDAMAANHNGQPYLRRWYQITPANNGSADVVLYFNQSDFDDYNSVVTPPYLPLPTSGNNADPNIANIRITKNDDAGLGNNPLVITPTVNWNGTYWELSFNAPGFSQFRVHGANPGGVPLPVSIVSFSGQQSGSSDLLNWTTAIENNNAYFTLQHSNDGINFKEISKVTTKAHGGNSNLEQHYTVTNSLTAVGHNYYRLMQTDIDGRTNVHAKMVEIIRGSNGSSVRVYPNPAFDVLNLDLFVNKAQTTGIRIMDMSGRVIRQSRVQAETGMNNISIAIGDVLAGLYTVQISGNEGLVQTVKFRKNN